MMVSVVIKSSLKSHIYHSSRKKEKGEQWEGIKRKKKNKRFRSKKKRQTLKLH